MKVREVNTSEADQRSARVFFQALFGFFDLSKASVLDAFARNGQLTVKNYYDLVSKVTCWELGEEHEEALRKYTSHVEIGDSYARLLTCKEQFDMIVVDTPQGIHKDSIMGRHVEHFDFFRMSLKNLNPGGIVVLYCNKSPYNKDEVGSQGYDEYEEYDFKLWMEMRKEYYGTPEHLVSEDEAIRRYREVVALEGRTLGRVLLIPCFSDVPGKAPYAFRVALEVL